MVCVGGELAMVQFCAIVARGGFVGDMVDINLYIRIFCTELKSMEILAMSI